MTLAQQLQRCHLTQLTPYASARRSMTQQGVWLNANEAATTPSSQQSLNRYPSFQCDVLNVAYANYAQVKPEQVLSCRGSDEAIDLLIRSFCEPGHEAILITSPTYGMYAISAQTQGVQVIDVPLIATTANQLQLNVSGISRALEQFSIKLIFLCNPSNPIGNCLSLAAIAQVLDTVGSRALVVVDEAYIEYAAASFAQPLHTVTSWLSRYPQLVVLRTLSKAFGLAAIRCGFALANCDVIEVLRKVIAPYPLPQPTIDYASAALSYEGINNMHAAVQTTVKIRDEFMAQLAGKRWLHRMWPSVTNFILLQVDNAAELVNNCAQQGVLIREQSHQLGLANTIRISIGSRSELQRLLEVLP